MSLPHYFQVWQILYVMPLLLGEFFHSSFFFLTYKPILGLLLLKAVRWCMIKQKNKTVIFKLSAQRKFPPWVRLSSLWSLENTFIVKCLRFKFYVASSLLSYIFQFSRRYLSHSSCWDFPLHSISGGYWEEDCVYASKAVGYSGRFPKCLHCQSCYQHWLLETPYHSYCFCRKRTSPFPSPDLLQCGKVPLLSVPLNNAFPKMNKTLYFLHGNLSLCLMRYYVKHNGISAG